MSIAIEVNYLEVKDDANCPILYDYKHYENPRRCLYSHPTDDYMLPAGWVQKTTEAIVIGEDSTSYITKLIRTSDQLNNDNEATSQYILPMGFHKSRLIKWLPTQLKI